MSDRDDSTSNDSNYEVAVVQTPQANSKGCNMLRPSLFSSTFKTSTDDSSSKAADLEQNVVNNPFLKEYKVDDANIGEKKVPAENDKKTEIEPNREIEENEKVNLLNLNKNSLPKSNLFPNVQNPIPAENIGFVFGQNVHERVTGAGENLKSSSNSTSTTGEDSTSKTEDNQDNKSSAEHLFANAIQNSNNNKIDNGEPATKSTDIRSLTEVAREYEESRAKKRKYEEVETFTGEENEQNILDISCKLFAFVNCNWEERGRGSLRLNDSKETKEVSRVVFRTSGNLRLLLNTKVWPDMIAERPSPKSLRLTAMDNNGQIKIFLAMSRPEDINIIYNALVKRINILKLKENDESDSDSIKENQKASTGSDSIKENQKASTGSDSIEENQKASTGSDSIKENQKASTGSDSIKENQKASTGSDSIEENQKASTGSDSIKENQKASTGSDSIKENQKASTGTDEDNQQDKEQPTDPNSKKSTLEQHN